MGCLKMELQMSPDLIVLQGEDAVAGDEVPAARSLGCETTVGMVAA